MNQLNVRARLAITFGSLAATVLRVAGLRFGILWMANDHSAHGRAAMTSFRERMDSPSSHLGL